MNEAEFGLYGFDRFSRFPVRNLNLPNVIYVADTLVAVASDLGVGRTRDGRFTRDATANN